MKLRSGLVHGLPGSRKCVREIASIVDDGARTKRLGILGARYNSIDESVHVHYSRGSANTIASVRTEMHPDNPARWAAITAYAAKAGHQITRLSVQVPGLLAAREWEGRTEQKLRNTQNKRDDLTAAHEREVQALISDTTISESEFNRRRQALERKHKAEIAAQAPEQSVENQKVIVVPTCPKKGTAMAKFYRDIGDAEQAALTPDPNLTPWENAARTSALYDQMDADADPANAETRYQDDPDTVSEFLVRDCEGLPDIANTLADVYVGMVFHCDDDPRITVANALGAPNLEVLELAWDHAMQLSTPLAAGQLVLAEYTCK